MKINTLLDSIREYLNSLSFLVTVALLSFFTWLIPSPYLWITATLYLLLGFLPLVAKDGRSYLPLFLGDLILSHDNVSFSSMPTASIVVGAFLFLSLILYIILHKPKMRATFLFYTLLALGLVFFVSYVYVSINLGGASPYGILYILCLIYFLVIYLLLCSVIGKEETLPYYAEGVITLSVAISLEVFIGILTTRGFGLADDTFTLGWSYTRETASTLLVLSLPFYSLLIREKNLLWFLPEVFPLAAIILLSTDSGLCALLLFIIPLAILTLNNYGRSSSYLILFILFGLGALFGLLMGTDSVFNSRITSAFKVFAFVPEEGSLREQAYQSAIAGFITNPILGPSINMFVQDNGTLAFSFNTYLSTLGMGGSLGLGAYLLYEVSLYFEFAKKKTPGKWIFFLFLLMFEFIGLVDNTIYNLAIFLFYLTSICCFEMTSRPEDVQIHEDYFQYQEENREY